MATRLHFARINKELAFSRVFNQAKNQSLVAVATIGNTSSADKYKVRYDLEGVGATVNLSRNTLKAKGLEMLGDDAMKLAPLLRGKTLLACGPAEVPMAKQLLALEKALPEFVVLGALLNGSRILQARDVDKLSKLPPLDELHVQMVSQMLPGTALQVPNVAAYLCSVLQARVDSMQQEGGGGESS